jgi:small subunit ribosomal protein S13
MTIDVLKTNLTERTFFFSLQKIYGIGPYRAYLLCNILGFNFKIFPVNKCSTSLSFYCENIIEKLQYILQDELLYKTKQNIQLLVKLRNFKGIRHSKSLPVRGQRTHTNAKTNKLLKKKKKI